MQCIYCLWLLLSGVTVHTFFLSFFLYFFLLFSSFPLLFFLSPTSHRLSPTFQHAETFTLDRRQITGHHICIPYRRGNNVPLLLQLLRLPLYKVDKFAIFSFANTHIYLCIYTLTSIIMTMVKK